MNILIIANYKESVGGISGQVKLLYEKLKQEGECVRIFSTKGNVLVRLWLFLKLFFVARHYDVLHVHACSHWGFLPAVYGVLVGRMHRKRIVLTYHGGGGEDFFSSHPKVVRWFLTRTDSNIVLSGFLAEVFVKYHLPYVIIPNILGGSDILYVQKTEIKPRFISVRTLVPLYNVACIVKAFELVKREMPDATLAILGDGSSRQELERYVNEHCIQDITFYGHVKNKDIDNYLGKADIFLSAPTTDNQPMSILEAFRAGLLVISSRVGGVPYMVEHGVTGLLFDNNNHEELALLMIQSVEKPQTTLRMISDAKKQLAFYSWSHIREKLYNCYRG